MGDLAIDHDVRAGKGLFDVAEGAAAGEVEIPGHRVVHERRSGGHRALECCDGREWIEVQANQLERVGGCVSTVRDHRRHHLADEAQAIRGEDRTVGRDNARRGQVHRQWPAGSFEVGSGEDGEHARCRSGG